MCALDTLSTIGGSNIPTDGYNSLSVVTTVGRDVLDVVATGGGAFGGV